MFSRPIARWWIRSKYADAAMSDEPSYIICASVREDLPGSKKRSPDKPSNAGRTVRPGRDMSRGVGAGPWMTLRSDQTVFPHRIFGLLESRIGYQLNRWKNLMPGVAVAVLLCAVPLNVLSDSTHSPLPVPPNQPQAEDDTRLWLPPLDTGFRTQISADKSLLSEDRKCTRLNSSHW